MRILGSIVSPSTTLMSSCDSKITGGGSIRSQIVRDQLVWDKAILLQELAHEFQRCHIRKQTAARRSLFKALSALKQLLFLPSLIALLVKESGAITAARIGSREAFDALMAV